MGDVVQTIAGGTATNTVALAGPLAATTLSARAAVEVRSPARLAVRFERGGVATPVLVDGDGLPDTVTVLGTAIDLGPVKAALAPAAAAARAAAERLAAALPADLTFPIPANDKASTWLINTYLDADTRVARGDGGSVFVMTREPASEESREAAVAEILAEAVVIEVAAETLVDE